MSLNKKGFVLIETLAVTVFAATIFVFLFKSVVPIMSIYDTKIDQIGNIDAVYNNYQVRKMIYNDDCYNNKCKDGSGNYINTDAIKNLDYTMIRCDDYYYTNGRSGSSVITSGDKKYFSRLYSSDYCNKLMEAIGARTKSSSNYTTDHYWIFYIKGSKIQTFLNEGLGKKTDGTSNKYYSLGPALAYNTKQYSVQGTQFSDDTEELIKKSLRDLMASKDFKDTESYLLFYYWYINPMYSESTDPLINPNVDEERKKIEPKFKDALSILNIKSSSENLYCFKFQVVPRADYYHYQLNSKGHGKYYFYYDEKYDITKQFTGDATDRCMKQNNGKRVNKLDDSCNVVNGADGHPEQEVLGSTTVRKYCDCQRTANPSNFNDTYSGDSLKECTKYMTSRNVSVNISNQNIANQGFDQIGKDKTEIDENGVKLTEAEATAYCQNLLRNHNQAYKIYTLSYSTDGTNYNSATYNNCIHYFGSYNSITVQPTSGGKKGNYTTLDFKSNPNLITDLCQNNFKHYYLDTIWDDFSDARIGIPSYDYGEAELAIIDYDENCSKDVVIPNTAYNDYPITVIGAHAFEKKGIRTVKFNGTIKLIDKNAFANNVYTLVKPSGALVIQN